MRRLRCVVTAVVLATVAVLGQATVATAATPTISGTPAVGEVLTAVTDADPPYAWLRDGQPIDGATGQTYTAVPADLGHAVSVRVTPAGEAPVESAPVTIGPGAAPVNTEAPVITGGDYLGNELTVTTGTWSRDGLSYSYQWLRDGDPIDGATAATYTLTSQDRCSPISVTVTATEEGYADGVATSPDFSPYCVIVDPAPVRISTVVGDGVLTPRDRPVVKIRLGTAGALKPSRGLVTLRVDRQAALTKRLHPEDEGRLRFRLPRQHVGKHTVRVRYDAPAGSIFRDGAAATTFRVRRHA